MTFVQFFLGVTFIVTSVVLFAEVYDMWGKKDL